MKPLGETAHKAMKHRKFHWCRRPNGFSDMPLWRVVAADIAMPAYQVIAFVNRLEELGNAAANHGEARGAVARFSASEFAMALGMSVADCERIFAALERPEVGWIAYGHIADFYDRNPDREDETAAERKRRQRLRETIRHQLAGLARKGLIGRRRRLELEELLSGSEAELRDLQVRLAQIELEAREQMSRGVTRDIGADSGTNDSTSGEAEDFQKVEKMSSVTRDGRMSQRDIVTVTPEQSRDSTDDEFSVVPLGSNLTPIDPAVFAEKARALQWLKGDGEALITSRLGVLRSKAIQQIERWDVTLCHDLTALARIIYATLSTEVRGDAFKKLVTEQVARHAAEMITPALKFGPVPIQKE